MKDEGRKEGLVIGYFSIRFGIMKGIVARVTSSKLLVHRSKNEL